jgi:hypothetical protein
MMTRPLIRSALLIMVSALALASSAGNRANASGGITTLSPQYPPADADAAYVSQNSTTYPNYPGGIGNVVVPAGFVLGPFTNIQITTQGANELSSFNATFSGITQVEGMTLGFSLTGTVDVTTFGKAGLTLGTFATQMTSMDMTGIVGGDAVTVDLNPNVASTGQTTIADNGNGTFQIQSFFDIFTEVQITSAGPFVPQSGDTLITLQTVPEPSAWVLALTAGLIVPAACLRSGRGPKLGRS